MQEPQDVSDFLGVLPFVEASKTCWCFIGTGADRQLCSHSFHLMGARSSERVMSQVRWVVEHLRYHDFVMQTMWCLTLRWGRKGAIKGAKLGYPIHMLFIYSLYNGEAVGTTLWSFYKIVSWPSKIGILIIKTLDCKYSFFDQPNWEFDHQKVGL